MTWTGHPSFFSVAGKSWEDMREARWAGSHPQPAARRGPPRVQLTICSRSSGWSASAFIMVDGHLLNNIAALRRHRSATGPPSPGGGEAVRSGPKGRAAPGAQRAGPSPEGRGPSRPKAAGRAKGDPGRGRARKAKPGEGQGRPPPPGGRSPALAGVRRRAGRSPAGPRSGPFGSCAGAPPGGVLRHPPRGDV